MQRLPTDKIDPSSSSKLISAQRPNFEQALRPFLHISLRLLRSFSDFSQLSNLKISPQNFFRCIGENPGDFLMKCFLKGKNWVISDNFPSDDRIGQRFKIFSKFLGLRQPQRCRQICLRRAEFLDGKNKLLRNSVAPLKRPMLRSVPKIQNLARVLRSQRCRQICLRTTEPSGKANYFRSPSRV